MAEAAKHSQKEEDEQREVNCAKVDDHVGRLVAIASEVRIQLLMVVQIFC